MLIVDGKTLKFEPEKSKWTPTLLLNLSDQQPCNARLSNSKAQRPLSHRLISSTRAVCVLQGEFADIDLAQVGRSPRSCVLQTRLRDWNLVVWTMTYNRIFRMVRPFSPVSPPMEPIYTRPPCGSSASRPCTWTRSF